MREGGRSVGRALQAALAHGEPEEDLGIEGPSLAKAHRRHIFRYLCLRPCARAGEIGRALSLSEATVRWHERNLIENGYLDMDGPHLYPRGLIDPRDVVLFALLAAPGRDAVLGAALADPGISLRELASRVGVTRQTASKAATELAEVDLLTSLEDGRFRRLYPTSLLQRKREANRARADAFVGHLLRRLQEDRLAPETLRRDDSMVLLRFGVGSQRVVLDIPLDPYLTAWNFRS